MPEIGRWNGIDQLAEMYVSTSTYAYVANNPILRFDVDGRWFRDDGTIDTSGRTPYFTSGRQMHNSFLGMKPGDGGAGYSFTGNAAGSMYNYFLNGGSVSGLSFKNGYAKWWEGDATETGYRIGDEMYGQGNVGIMHSVKVNSDTSWDAYKDWTDYGSTTIGTMFQSIADHRTDFYNKGFWVDRAGNIRGVSSNGSRSSVGGLRTDYLRTTTKFGKYAEKTGWVGYILGGIEIGEGVATDYNNYQTSGKTNAQNTIINTTKVASGMLVGMYTGAAIGTLIPIPVVGTIIGAVGGAVAGYIAGEAISAEIENTYYP